MLINKIKNRISEAATEACGYSPLTKVVSEEEINRILEQESGWIPCSEQIPEEPEENPLFEGKCLEVYLVTTKYGSNAQDKVYPFRAFWNGINFTDGMNILDVIAWMPLPEPYRVSAENAQPKETPLTEQPQTNADRIRSMTDEELAEWITNMCEFERHGEPYKSIYNLDTDNEEEIHDSYGDLLSWLKAESEG